MRKVILRLVLGATMLAAPLAMAPSASAEPRHDIWKCWNVREEWVIPRTEFYACPLMSIKVIDSYTGDRKHLLDGTCANDLWNNSGRRATWQDAIRRCER
jgi:hypothetical protein